MPTPDMSALPAADLQAIARGDMSSVSEPSLHYLAGTQMPIPKMKPNTGLAGTAGNVIEAAMTPLDALASATSHIASGVMDPMLGLGARVHALLRGEDPDAAAAAVHKWVAGPGTYHAVTAGGKTAGNATTSLLGTAMTPFNAAGNAIDSATGHDPILENAAGGVSDVLGTAATVIPGASALMDAARAPVANAANVAKTGAEVAEQAGYKGLQSRQDLALPGPQSITNKLGADDAGMPTGQAVNAQTVSDRLGVVGKQYNAAGAQLPTVPITGDAASAIQNAGSAQRITKGTPAAANNLQALKDQLLAGPVTGPQVVKELQALRQEGYTQLGSDDISAQLEGHARLQMADALDQHIEDNLPPDSGVNLPQTRTDYAKASQLLASLKGGENIDPAVYGRILAKDPDLLTGNAKIIAQVHQALPAAPPFGVERGLVHGAGAVGGAVASHMLGGSPGMDVAAGAGASVAAPYITRMLHNMFSGGDLEAAGSTATNPALSYHFNPGEDLPEGWNRSAPTPPPQRQPLLLGHDAPPPTVNAGGGAATNSILDQLGLTSDVQQAGAMHPGAPNAPPETFQPPPGQMGEAHPPLLQNWHGAGPDGVPNFSTAPGAGGAGAADNRGIADILSSLVPDNIMSRTAAPGGRPLYEALNRTPDQLDDELQALAAKTGAPVKEGGVANRGSNDAGVSPEFANVQDADRAAGIQRSVIDPDGNGTPVNGLAARDLGVTGNSGGASVPKGHVAIDERPGQPPTIINRGGLSPQAAKGLMNRFLSLRESARAATAREPSLGDLLGS